MTASGARMEAFECPICAPKRYFVTEIGLRTHVADRHPWRSLPPDQTRIPPSKAVMPEPAWLRDRQIAAAAGQVAHLHQQVTFDTQSQLSDEVFFDEGGVSGGGRGRNPNQQQQYRYQQQLQLQLQQLQQEQQQLHQQQQQLLTSQQNFDPYTADEYPPPDYDLPPANLAQAVDAVDSSSRKRRELATSRRPWYDSEDYEGPRNLMEKPGGYYQFDDPELNGRRRRSPAQPWPPGGAGSGGYSEQRMTRELDDRDGRIETLRLEIDRLWDERMRLLKQEAERTRAAKDQAAAYGMSPGGFAQHRRGLQQQQQQLRGRARDLDGLLMNRRSHDQGHAFQPVVPHSRLQLHRAQQYPDRRAIDY